MTAAPNNNAATLADAERDILDVIMARDLSVAEGLAVLSNCIGAIAGAADMPEALLTALQGRVSATVASRYRRHALAAATPAGRA